MRPKLFIIWEEKQAQKEQLYVLLFDAEWVLKKLTLAELQQFSLSHDSTLVLPAATCSIFKLRLPKVNAKDLSLAVAAMLEDKILGNFTDFYSYIEKLTTEDYLVCLWEKNGLADIQAFFEKHQIIYQSVTLDWFALKPNEIFLMADGGAFVYSDAVQGYLNRSVFKHWFQNYSFDALSMYAAESYPEYVGVQAVNESFWVWMAKRLSAMPLKDIFAKPKRFDINTLVEPKKLWSYFPKIMTTSIAAVLGVFLTVYIGNWVVIKKNQSKLQAIIAIADDDIEQRLNRYLDKQKQKNQFWSLWTAIQGTKNHALSISNIQYQQRKMKLNLTAMDMQAYQQFKRQLTRAHVRITNSQLQTEASGIRLMLELQGTSNE